MASTINIYCDESCHLERDTASVMVLGALACPTSKAREIADRLRDFRDRHDHPDFEGRRCACKRHPMIDGKEATFWHLISEGNVEDDRLPDLRRCERIRWPRSMIERSPDRLRVWRSERPGDRRIVIALADFSYVVVLADRGDYVILWTAYCVEHEHRRAKLRNECERAKTSWGRP